jgi:putative flippase GtrA
MAKVKSLYAKHTEIILYLIFGIITTIINLATYFFLARVVLIDEVISNCIAWVVSVTFAFVTNKIYVFKSKTRVRKEVLREMTSFFSFRIISGFLDISVFAFCVKVMFLDDAIVKIAIQIFVTIFNYVASKLIIFRKAKS